MQTKTQLWLQHIRQQAQLHQLNHIDMLVNATDMQCDHFKEMVNLKPLPYVSWLFENTPEQNLAHDGPTLIRLEWDNQSHQRWLETFVELVYNDFRINFILSPWSFTDLATVLRHYSQASWMNGLYGGLFRYYEPRLLPTIYQTLNEQQQAEFGQTFIQWHYLDRDSAPQQITGNYQIPQAIQSLTPFKLSDEQLNKLFVLQAAESYRSYYMLQPKDYGLNSQQTLFNYLIEAQTHAYQQGKQQLTERDEFVKNWLDQNIQTLQA